MTGAETQRARSGSRRDDVARLAVLHAADDLLAENGFRGLTVEAIAKRAGVAKQTIYRWWPSKIDILLDTLIEDSDKKLAVPSEATSDAIRGHVRALARFLVRDPDGAVFLTLVAEAQHDPAVATALHERYLTPRRAQLRDLVVRATEAGEVAPKLDADAVVDAVIGPIVYRALLGLKVPRGFVDGLVDLALTPPR